MKPFNGSTGISNPSSTLSPSSVVAVGVDDGCVDTKVALADGRLVCIPSCARLGTAGVIWLRPDDQRVFEYETDGHVYVVGAGEPPVSKAHPGSALNRVVVQHALQRAGLAGRSVHLVSGLPDAAFHHSDGQLRAPLVHAKREGLKRVVEPRRHPRGGGQVPSTVSVASHAVIPQALAAWYDFVIVTQEDGVTLDADRLNTPIAIVDIGGRTTDCAVVQHQRVVHGTSGSLNRGMLNVMLRVAYRIQELFGLEHVSEHSVTRAVNTHRLYVHGTEHDVSSWVKAEKRELVEQLYQETRRTLGHRAHSERVLFVGGGSAAVAEEIAEWFPHPIIAERPAFAHARGMLKFRRFVSRDPDETM